jgi:hypothetical protein
MMSTALLPIAAALLATFMAVSFAAQGNPAATQAAKEVQTVTIVGCLVQGDPTAERGDRVATGSASSAGFFVRTPTLAVPAGGTVAVGKPGTTSTSTSSGTPTSDSFYRITGLDDEQLRPHVGHRVEVRGELSADTSGTAARAKTTVDSAGRATTTVETRPLIAGSVRATTIKMVSDSCS